MSSYDDLLQGFSSEDKKKDRLASSLSEAAVTNPDEFANMVKLSKAASISIESIPDYKNEAEQAKYLGEVGFSRLWKDAPKTSEFLSDPTNAKLARNDVPAMGFLERKIRSLGDGVVGLGGSALSGTGYTLDAMQRRILMGAASFLPKPMAGGEVTDESIVGQTMGDDWRYVAAPLKDASKSISVPKDQRDFGDDVMQAIGQIGGQFALGPLNLPTMFAQGVDMQAERSIKDNASQANKDWSMLGSGAWTMITEKVLGIDRWAKMGPLTSIKNPVGARVGGVGLAAASEGVQETLENVGQDALRKGLTNENADIGFGDAAYAGGVGATAAGVVRSFIESALHIKARRTQEFFTDLGDAAKQSELINRAPDKMSEFIAQAAHGGPVENVFIPSDQFVRYFQEVGADPVEAAQAMGVTNYTEAIAAGTDVIIPLGEFAARVAPSEHLQGLMPDLRLHQGDATARELMAMEADRDTREAYLKQQLESLIAEGETSRGLNLAIDRITQDVEGQLLGAGVEPSTARTQAQVMRGVAVLAQRAFPNEEPLAAAEKLWSQYGLTVNRELPPILTKLKNADVQLDPLLDRLRAAAMPSQTEVFGQPLHEFLRAMGGVQDQGGELSARDADVGNAPFVKNLIQAAGLDIDGAREIAAQQGFPVGESEADFISALTASFEGNPVYSPNQENPQALDLLQTLESLDKALKDAGVDLNAVDNATARKMLEQAGEVSGARFEQSANINGMADKDTVAGTQAPTSAGDVTPEMARSILDGISDIPDGWYVHGRARSEKLTDGWPIQMTRSVDIASGYAGNSGSVWMIKPKAGSVVADFSSSDSADMDKFISNLRAVYADQMESGEGQVYDLVSELNTGEEIDFEKFEEYVRDEFTPAKIVDSAQAFDNDMWINLLQYFNGTRNGWPDFVVVPSGAVVMPGMYSETENVSLTKLSNESSASAGSDVLYQSQDKKRGFLQIGANRQMQIGLTENSNLSTFLHETGHFYLEVMGDLAGNADAAQQVKDDYAAILKWMGVTDRSQIKTEQHEQFARANEAYLREGKAPSPELQGAFQRFKAWLSYLYRNLASMNVTLNDEVRAVFDRIYATDAEIDAASDKVDVAPLFLTAELMGMSPEEFALYRERVGKVSADAQDKLLTKLMLEYERGRKEWWKEERANVREEVAAEVDAQPVYRAFAALVSGEFNGQPFKLNKADLVSRFGEPYLKTLPRGFQRIYAGDGGIDVEMAAEVFGYATGEDMIKALVEMRNRRELIEAEADARMKERHGDMLTDGTAAVAAVEALHNDERANVLAVELRALNRLANAMDPARKLERQKATAEQRARVAATETPNLSWFKSAAQGRLEQMVLRDINPNSYLIAGRRAAREAFAALARNDHQTAAAAKQRELLNHYLYLESVKAKADLDKIDQRFKKMLTGSDEKTAKSRDLDLVMAARAILADFGYGGKAKKAAAYLEKVKDYDPATHAVLMQSVEAAEELAASLPPNSKGPALRDLTTLQLRALADEVEALWFLAKRNRTMEIDGNLIDLQEIDDQLLSRLTDIGIPFRVAGEGYAITEGEMKIKDIRTFIASARRVEHWVDAIDGKEGENKIGLFRKYVWSPISDAAVAYRADKAKFLRKFRESFKSIEETLKPNIIAADELGYVFGKDSGGSAMNEILHAILHTGNESNKRKLLLGRNWATLREDGSLDTSRWDSFVSRMISEGNITKAHYDFAQSIWDLLESMKPMAQKTHREVFGKYFDEVTAQEFVTPFGIYRGGYVPAMADSRIVSDAAMRDLQEQENQAMSFAFPTTSKGFTKARTEYNRPLMLDMRSLAQHIDKVLMFSRMEIPVRDVRKALGKEAGQALARIDPTIIGGMITPWLNRAAKQQVETPISGAGRLMRFFSVIRSRAGAAAMFGNLVNTAQQITGFSLAALKVKPSLMLSSTADYMKHPGKFTKAVSEASPYMATRMENEVAAMSGEINDILLNPSLLENGQNWAMKHAYFMQSAVDNVMSPIIWTAAYNQAIEGGNDHKDAVRLADAAVRQTQGSTQPEDISRIEGGNAFVRMFTQFAGYFNMQANLLGAQFITLSRDYGLMNSKGRAFFIFTAGFLIPAMMSEVIVQAFRGGPDDEDKDGEYLDDWLSALFMGSVRTATAMVPVVGQGVMSVINASNSKPYDDRLATPPAISMLESAARAPFSATKAINGEGSNQKAVRDVATLVSMTLGIPVNVAAKPIGYASGVSDGRISPTSNADMVRGSITGVASADSKR